MPVDGALNAPGLTAVVTKTRSRQTMGDDQPRPGTSTAQATFSVVDQVLAAASIRSATPDPPGPRNCGHSSGPAARIAGTSGNEQASRAAAGANIDFRMRHFRTDAARKAMPAPLPGNVMRRGIVADASV